MSTNKKQKIIKNNYHFIIKKLAKEFEGNFER